MVTLVITIVIMLILAGLIIDATIDDGIIDDAYNTTEQLNNRIVKDEEITAGIIGDIKDELTIKASGIILDTNNVVLKIGDTKTLTATISPSNSSNKVINWSSSNPSVATVKNGVITAIKGGQTIITATSHDGNEIANCTVKVNPFDTTKVANIVVETSTIAGINKERIAPIPTGYVPSEISGENTIQGGLVIYQGNTPVAGTANSTEHIDAMEKRNQYVWTPVDDVNDMVMCKQNGNTGTDGSTKICNLEYDVTTNQITCKTHNYSTATELTDTNIDTTGLAGRYYYSSKTGPDENGVYKSSTSFTENTKNSHEFVANSNYREPDLITDKDNNNYQLASEGISSSYAFKYLLNEKFIEMAKSVAKYGGFYTSRFEASFENNKVISKKNKPVLTSTVYNSAIHLVGDKWYGLYNKTLNRTEKGESVNSHMIWGCQYDQIIKFLGPQKAETGHTYQTKEEKMTGFIGDEDIINNIYDLEGNHHEWLAQAYGTGSRVSRGNAYDMANAGEFFPTTSRSSSSPESTSYRYTTRPTLYIIP